MRRRHLCGAFVGVLATAGALTAVTASAAPAVGSHALAKRSVMRPLGFKPAKSKSARPRRTNNLVYQGGIGGIGVETAPRVFLVVWGSQWGTNGSIDPSGEVPLVQNFIGKAGGSSWLNSVTQYCQGVAAGTVTCGTSGQHAGNQSGMYAGTWFDAGSAAPSQPTQSQLASEAVRAAAHFNNTSSAVNNTVQYVIATATHNSSSGFGTQYCAWHSSTPSSAGNIAYTNLPYITDAGASCGAGFNGLGSKAGITIVEGHEMAETITDQFPNGGWLDRNGAENGDKCAWTSGTSNQTLNGSPFPVQPLWSNATSNCVLSY